MNDLIFIPKIGQCNHYCTHRFECHRRGGKDFDPTLADVWYQIRGKKTKHKKLACLDYTDPSIYEGEEE